MFEPVVSRNSDPREVLRASIWATGAPNPVEYRIRNLSMCGACVEHEGGLESGAPTTVSIGLMVDVPAVISWVREGMAGIRFDQPIDLRAARRMPIRGA